MRGHASSRGARQARASTLSGDAFRFIRGSREFGKDKKLLQGTRISIQNHNPSHLFGQKLRIDDGLLWVTVHELAAPKTLPVFRALDAIPTEINVGSKDRQICALEPRLTALQYKNMSTK